MAEYERQYEDGSDPRVLDVVDVPLLHPNPDGYQAENWFLDPRYYWRKIESLSPRDLPRLLDPVGPLWIDGHETVHGRNDKIPLALANTVSSSLRLIGVDSTQLVVLAPGEAFGNSKRRVQARFVHARSDYALWVTDPDCERRYLAKADGSYRLGPRYLTISLGEPFKGAAYKLVAAIIRSDTQ